jgi:thiol-disulfide isomerase/thioredoxin
VKVRGVASVHVRSLLVLAPAFFWAIAAVGQDPILTFSVSPDPVTIQAGSVAELRLRIENTSIREADDIAASWAGTEAFELAAEPEEIKLLGPFETTNLPLALTTVGASEGAYDGQLQILYTYCIGDLCYQIVERLDVGIRVEPASEDVVVAPVEPIRVEPPREPFPWPWIGFGAAVLLAVGLLVASRSAIGRRLAAVGLLLIVAGGLAYGVMKNQHNQARSIGSVLCISCVGLEEAHPASEVRLSEAALDALRTLDEDVELTVFYALWCHSCPYAEEMVEQMAAATDRITYRLVDVETSPAEAAEAGIVESDRTIVPAVTRAGSMDVVFGIEDLEARLLELLGMAP